MKSSETHNPPVAAEIRELILSFPGQKNPLFDGLSLDIRCGEKVLLLGPSGSGKSTLLKVLTGLIPETIELPVKWTERRCFNSWGYVFQNPDAQFCMPYVDEEIAFVLENRGLVREEMPLRIHRYLHMVGLEFEEIHHPIANLSQGQKQRLALASALALQPKTLVLDEPTALLDPDGTHAIWQKVSQLGRDKTLLIVEHKIEEVINLMDRVLVLDEHGKLIIECTAKDIQKHRTLLDRYGIWHAQSWAACEKKASAPEVTQSSGNEAAVLEIDRLAGYHGEKKCITLQSLEVYSGEWIAITGPNGAGKSSLLLALMQLIRTEGCCRLYGEQIQHTEQVASEIGFVFQNPELQFVARKVRGEIAFTLQQQAAELSESDIQKRVDDTLDQYGLTKVAAQNPYQLSTGQQRRLSVASTTVKERDLLLLDEPTFGQDAANTFAILHQIEQCRRRGTSILMVTHDREIVRRFATRQWQIEAGQLQHDTPGRRVTRTNPGESIHAV